MSASHQLRVPIVGTLAALRERQKGFLMRMGEFGFVPVEPLTAYQKTGYRSDREPVAPPFAVFELQREDGSLFPYPQRKLIHLAGMTRHVAIAAAKKTTPPDAPPHWTEQFVAGHVTSNAEEHRQVSYLPLPTIGHRFGDQLVRRLLLTAPQGDERWLRYLADQVQGERLRPEYGNEFSEEDAPRLVRIAGDNVTQNYTRPSSSWHSVTPVILPGHDDHKPAKTRRLIERALAMSGITEPCQYEWGTVSRFRKSFSAHKRDRSGQPAGYLRPDHLLSQTAVHLSIHFQDDVEYPGPIAIGAGRHCGFGLMAQENSIGRP